MKKYPISIYPSGFSKYFGMEGFVSDLLSGNTIYRYLTLLEKSQWWHREKLEKYQEKKLRKLIHHAYHRVPYYRKIFDRNNLKPVDIKGVDDLKKLPLLEKKDFFENGKLLRSKDYKNRRWTWDSSGGTSGETLVYMLDRKSRDFRRAANLRGFGFAGLRLGDKYAYLRATPEYLDKYTSTKKLIDFFRKALFINCYNVNEEKSIEICEKIKKYSPVFIRGFPSTLSVISNFYDGTDLGLKAIVTTGETLLEDDRILIESKFNCRVFDEYGGEASAKANECSCGIGYLYPSEGAIFEFLRNGENVVDGEIGEIVVTDLNNYVMPFIRYRIGDIGIPSSDYCKCGRGLPVIKQIEGRISDKIITPDGGVITRPVFFGSGNFKKLHGLREYQVHQKSLNEVILSIVVDSNFSSETKGRIIEILENILGPKVFFSLKIVDKIPKAKSGKRKAIISDVEYKFN